MRLRAVVLRDCAAARDAAIVVHVEEAGFENVAADIVEIDVDALGHGGAHRFRKAFGLVVDGGVEAEFARQQLALGRPSRDAHRTATLDLRDLPDDRAD